MNKSECTYVFERAKKHLNQFLLYASLTEGQDRFLEISRYINKMLPCVTIPNLPNKCTTPWITTESKGT